MKGEIVKVIAGTRLNCKGEANIMGNLKFTLIMLPCAQGNIKYADCFPPHPVTRAK